MIEIGESLILDKDEVGIRRWQGTRYRRLLYSTITALSNVPQGIRTRKWDKGTKERRHRKGIEKEEDCWE